MFKLLHDYRTIEDLDAHDFVQNKEDFKAQEVYEKNGCYLFVWKEEPDLLAAGIYVKPDKRHMLPLKSLKEMMESRLTQDKSIQAIVSYTTNSVIKRLFQHLGFEYLGNTWYIKRKNGGIHGRTI